MNSVFKTHFDDTQGHYLKKMAKASLETAKEVRSSLGTGKTLAYELAISILVWYLHPSCRTHMCDPNASIFFVWSCREIIAVPLATLVVYDAIQHINKQLQEHSRSQPLDAKED